MTERATDSTTASGASYEATGELSWERFLSPRDAAYLAATDWTKREPFGLGSRPALLVIDDYYEVVGTERLPLFESLARWPKTCGLEGWEAIDRTRDLIAAARSAEVPVVYITKLDGFGAPWGRRGPRTRPKGRTDEMDRLSSQIVAEIAPEAGDLVLHKTAPSAFRGTPLEFWLTYHGIDTLLVAGESTSGCVRASVVDAATNRLRVGVVADCCFDRIQASHWINLFDMDQKYADVMDLSAAVDYLNNVRGGAGRDD